MISVCLLLQCPKTYTVILKAQCIEKMLLDCMNIENQISVKNRQKKKKKKKKYTIICELISNIS